MLLWTGSFVSSGVDSLGRRVLGTKRLIYCVLIKFKVSDTAQDNLSDIYFDRIINSLDKLLELVVNVELFHKLQQGSIISLDHFLQECL